MALRTFRSNPSLGGFGGESTNLLLSSKSCGSTRRVDGDAFAQIIKELVDNAVDACRGGEEQDSAEDYVPRRVRVEIQRFRRSMEVTDDKDDDRADEGQSNNSTNSKQDQDILQVTVSDNGCGMSDIQTCVDPFHTSKAHATRRKTQHSTATETETAGRYGIGLTLCLLHAQRLVPGSCASIRSATPDDSQWSSLTCLVETETDSIKCVPGEPIEKSYEKESGTSVTVLVPVSATRFLLYHETMT